MNILLLLCVICFVFVLGIIVGFTLKSINGKKNNEKQILEKVLAHNAKYFFLNLFLTNFYPYLRKTISDKDFWDLIEKMRVFDFYPIEINYVFDKTNQQINFDFQKGKITKSDYKSLMSELEKVKEKIRKLLIKE